MVALQILALSVTVRILPGQPRGIDDLLVHVACCLFCFYGEAYLIKHFIAQKLYIYNMCM